MSVLPGAIGRTRPAALTAMERSRAVLQAGLRLDGGDSPADVIDFLVASGLPRGEATELIDRLVATSRQEDRRKGAIWLCLAALCFAFAAPFLSPLWQAIGPGHMGRGFWTSVALAGRLPVLLVLAGSWMGFHGLRFVLRRRYTSNPD